MSPNMGYVGISGDAAGQAVGLVGITLAKTPVTGHHASADGLLRGDHTGGVPVSTYPDELVNLIGSVSYVIYVRLDKHQPGLG